MRPAVRAGATVILLGLQVWFYLELSTGMRQLGLAERVLAGAEAVWPLAVVLTCYRSQSGARLQSATPPAGTDIQG
jgi:hypothetical protein